MIWWMITRPRLWLLLIFYATAANVVLLAIDVAARQWLMVPVPVLGICAAAVGAFAYWKTRAITSRMRKEH